VLETRTSGSHAADGQAVPFARLLDLEPDFATGVEKHVARQARARAIVPLVRLKPGPCDPYELRRDRGTTGPFAALVVDGVLLRDVGLGTRVASQVVGPGDVVTFTRAEPGPLDLTQQWRAATPLVLAVLDERFLAAAQRWPWLTARIVERTGRWCDRSATLQAISAIARVELRIVAMLWHLSERWGRVTPDGVVIPLDLTHGSIGQLVGAQRPTVTLALKELSASDAVRRSGRFWLLSPDSLDLIGEPAEAGRAAPARVLLGIGNSS